MTRGNHDALWARPRLVKSRKRPRRQVAEPAASPALVRLRVRLADRAAAIKAQVKKWKKGKVPAKVLAAHVGAFGPKPRLASWRRRVLVGAELRARTRKRRQVMRRESRRANR